MSIDTVEILKPDIQFQKFCPLLVKVTIICSMSMQISNYLGLNLN